MEETIRKLQEAVATYCWNADYVEFCQAIRAPQEGDYARKKWTQLQELQRGLAAFDAKTLTALLAPKVV